MASSTVDSDEPYARYGTDRAVGPVRVLFFLVHLASVSLLVRPLPQAGDTLRCVLLLVPAAVPITGILVFNRLGGAVAWLVSFLLTSAVVVANRLGYVELGCDPLFSVVVCSFGFLSALVFYLVKFRFRRLARHLLARSYTNPVTGLANRYRLFEDLRRATSPALALLVAERFNEINSCFGYRFGERYIREIAWVIDGTLNQTLVGISVYHVDRDTFAILQADSSVERYGGTFESRFRSVIRLLRSRTFTIGEFRFPVPVTVGIADGAVGDPLLLYNQAEQATVAAVYSGKSEMYHDDSEAVKFNIVENTNSLGLVSHAIGNDRVEVVYQPIMKNRGSHIEVFEALVRIRADDGSLVPPGSFLESAKLSSYHKELTRIVFQKTFAKMARSDADFSVNISLEDIVDEDFVPFLKELFQRAPSCRSRCILEITESEGIRNFADVRTFMAEVRQIGYRFAIDDFGSGYSNLANLVRLPVDYVKFDGEIVQALLDDPRAEVVVSKINEIAKALKIRTIAEFVDSKELLSRVRALKIDYSQGFLIGAPSSRLNNSPDFL